MSKSKPYNKRINEVCEYIHQNLDHDLSLERLSQVAFCSKFHFHRLFAATTGMGVHRYQLLARLKRASFRLAFEPKRKVVDIALEAGFESHEGFSRAFKRVTCVTPSQFRRQPNWQQWHACFEFATSLQGTLPMDVTLIDFTEQQVASITHQGSAQKVFDTAAKFIQWRKNTGLSPVESSDTFGIAWHDPATVPEDEFRFDICGTVKGDVPGNPFGITTGKIPGGRCAMVLHEGSHDRLSESVYYLYRQWLPDSGEELRDYPCFFQYLNLIHQVDECDLRTQVYLPLK